MSSKAAGIPRYRPFDRPALLRQGFRPFFLGAGIWALATMLLWILAVRGYVSMPTAFDPVGWHAHEMLFGFVVAAIAGFLAHGDPQLDRPDAAPGALARGPGRRLARRPPRRLRLRPARR